MRLAGLATALMVIAATLAGAAHAFETEEERRFPAARPGSELRVISTADTAVFTPIILAFQAENPEIAVTYVTASSRELMKALYEEGAQFDLAISSAMDLQTKLANDGLVRNYSSEATARLPAWARWRNRIFAFTQEPAVLVLSKSAFADLPVPTTREELIRLLRDNPERFYGRIGTYDVRRSGLGYLFATQDSRNTESYWRLTEIMGRLGARLYCCSSDMIADVSSGRLALAYNVLGSYAEAQLHENENILIVEPGDYLNVMLRTALIPTTARNTEAAGRMIDFLLSLGTRPELTRKTGLPPVDPSAFDRNNAFRPIRLGPGLLVFLDRMRRETFLRSWVSSIEQ